MSHVFLSKHVSYVAVLIRCNLQFWLCQLRKFLIHPAQPFSQASLAQLFFSLVWAGGSGAWFSLDLLGPACCGSDWDLGLGLFGFLSFRRVTSNGKVWEVFVAFHVQAQPRTKNPVAQSFVADRVAVIHAHDLGYGRAAVYPAETSQSELSHKHSRIPNS